MGLQRRPRDCRTRANKPVFHGDITASIINRFSKSTRNAASGFGVPVVAVAMSFQSTVQLPFPENGASVMGISSPT